MDGMTVAVGSITVALGGIGVADGIKVTATARDVCVDTSTVTVGGRAVSVGGADVAELAARAIGVPLVSAANGLPEDKVMTAITINATTAALMATI